jgi:signal peptidase I
MLSPLSRRGSRKPAAAPKRAEKESAASLTRFVLTLILLAWVIRSLVFAPFSIPSSSMLPTLYIGDYLVVAKWPYGFSRYSFPLGIPSFDGRIFGNLPKRGDVVVFRHPYEDSDLIKRVIGLPGETIEGRNGSIFINSKPLDEPYLPPDVRSRDFPPEKVPPNRVWVLGDNRQDSRDSTFFKSIDEHSIVGRAFVKIWPLNDLSLL